MTRSPEWIIDAWKRRRSHYSQARQAASRIAEVYDGTVLVPLPELDVNETAAVANLLSQGLDQTAMRIASVTPQTVCPPLTPGNTSSERRARTRARAHMGWWHQNNWPLLQRKRARWLIGYASTPVIIHPDPRRGIPEWDIRDPLSSFPAPMPEGREMLPDDCIFAFKRSWAFIADRYPGAARALNVSSTPDPDEMYEIVQYLDHDETVMVAVGKPPAPSRTPWGGRPAAQGAPYAVLERYPNLVGRCPVVVPHRISLNQARGQFDQMPGLYHMQARAMALWVIANERAIFPDTWFISRPNETVQVVERADGRAGIPGLVKGGDLREISMAPPPQVAQLIDTLERNGRTTASIPPDFGGEAPTNVRTGRAGENLLHSTVDFWVQEAQEVLGAGYQAENELAVAVARAYFGDRPKSFYVPFKGSKGHVDYVPNRDFDSGYNEVGWPHAGSDVNSLIVGIGQRLGLKEMSVRTAQELDPYIDDAEREHERIVAESLEAALLASLDQAAASGQLGPLEISRLTTMVWEERVPLADAVAKLHKETQDAQAASQQQPPGGPGGPPGVPGGPPTPGGAGGPPGGPPGPPGLMAPGLQQQLGVGPGNPPGGGVPTPSPSVAHMAALMSALKPRKMG